jgi:hypothetical protein
VAVRTLSQQNGEVQAGTEDKAKKKRSWFGWMKKDSETFTASTESDEYQFIRRIRNPMFYQDPEAVKARYTYMIETYP